MIQPYVQLVSPTDSLILDAVAGWGVTSINLGDPETRTNMQNAPQADGALDYTSYVGARTITLGMELVEINYNMWTMLTRLQGFLRPRVPLDFIIQMDTTSPLVHATIRRSSFANALQNIWIQNPVLQWIAPKGILEAVEATTTTVSPSTEGTEIGRNYDLTFDRIYPTSPVLGAGIATNLGNAEAYPIIRIYGECSNPVIWNDTQGKRLVFVGLNIGAGEYLEIDTRYKTIRYLSDPQDSRYNNVDFPSGSQWWTLDPGPNSIRLVPSSFSPGASAVVYHYDAYL